MIIDTSAIVAIIRQEPDAQHWSDAIQLDAAPKVSVASYVEAAVVLDGARDPVVSRELDRFLRSADMEVMPVTVEQGRLAREAYRDFGKGSGHPARLNFGDCFAYALAKETGEPLLYKGSDFTHTDVEPATTT